MGKGGGVIPLYGLCSYSRVVYSTEPRNSTLVSPSPNTFVTIPNITKKSIPAGNYMFKANNRNTRTRCEVFSKLTKKAPERRQVSLLLSLNIFHALF